MFNTYINDRLNAWARWVMSRAGGGLGFPKQVAFSRLSGGGPGSQLPAGLDENAYEVEQAVQTLRPELKQAVQAFYCSVGTVEQKAKDCHCCRDTLYSRLDRAHGLILDVLNGYACGEYPVEPVLNAKTQFEKVFDNPAPTKYHAFRHRV